MSLNSPLFYVIPEEAIQVAKAAFPEGNRYILLRDALGSLFHNPNFQHLFSHTGPSGEDPARLALITILQFAERLSDQKATNSDRPSGTSTRRLSSSGTSWAELCSCGFRDRLAGTARDLPGRANEHQLDAGV